eukprot:g24835.t1
MLLWQEGCPQLDYYAYGAPDQPWPPLGGFCEQYQAVGRARARARGRAASSKSRAKEVSNPPNGRRSRLVSRWVTPLMGTLLVHALCAVPLPRAWVPGTPRPGRPRVPREVQRVPLRVTLREVTHVPSRPLKTRVKQTISAGRRLKKIENLMDAELARAELPKKRKRRPKFTKWAQKTPSDEYEGAYGEITELGRAGISGDDVFERAQGWLPDVLMGDGIWKEPLVSDDLAMLFDAFSPDLETELAPVVVYALQKALKKAPLPEVTIILEAMATARHSYDEAYKELGQWGSQLCLDADDDEEGLQVHLTQLPGGKVRLMAWAAEEAGAKLQLWGEPPKEAGQALPGVPWTALLSAPERRTAPAAEAMRRWVAEAFGAPKEHVEAAQGYEEVVKNLPLIEAALQGQQRTVKDLYSALACCSRCEAPCEEWFEGKSHPMQRLPWVLCCAWAAAQPRLTPSQQQVIDRARNASRNASDAAEEQIAAQFATLGFRMEMQLQGQGGRHLAMLSASALLQSLKGALAQLEWVTNFGLDAESLKAHPGESAFGIDTLARYGGRFPTMWELLAENSSLVADVSEKQWGSFGAQKRETRVMEAAETGLYRLPPFAASPSRFSPPTVQEAQQRPRYLAGNTRRLPMGVRRYGAITAVLRNDVVRKRAVVVGSDSGGWESVCNHSVTPVHKPSWFLKVIEVGGLESLNA